MHIYLFDIDGTLISSGGAGKAALEAALRAEFGSHHAIGPLQLSGRTDRAIIRDLFGRNGIEQTPENLQRLLGAYLRLLPESLARLQGRVLPGIASLIQQLRPRRDVVLGLLTGNVRAGARVKLGHFELYDHFVCGGFGDEHFDRDDVAREALTAVCAHLSCTPKLEQVWVIGDTPLDVRCARSIGARAVAVGTGWHSMDELAAARPDVLLRDLTDPQALLARLS